MAISSVKVNINGIDYTLEYNSTSGTWEKSITAPNITSFNLSGGYYPVTVTAQNNAGTSTTVTANQNDALKLVVKERVAPTIILLSPTNGAYISNSQQPITFNIIDETNGSGINSSSIVLKIDNVAVSNISKTAIANGYNCSYTSSTALSDGSHTITIDASDNDGNTAAQVISTFTVDTIPPTLNITSPSNNAITANSNVIVAGTTNDSTSSPVNISIKVNGIDSGSVTIASNGSFNKSVPIVEGDNLIVITATDKAGKATSVTVNVICDLSVPNISNIFITPNPVDAGATMIVSVVVE